MSPSRLSNLKQSVDPVPPDSDTARACAFWLCASLGIALYSLVVLSPVLAERDSLRAQLGQVQSHNQRIGTTIEQYRELSKTIAEHQRLKAELVKLQSQPLQKGEEIIPVEEPLQLDRKIELPDVPEPVPAEQRDWKAAVVAVVAENQDVRGVILLSSVVMVLFAFGHLHASSRRVKSETTSGQPQPSRNGRKEVPPPKKTWIGQWMKRYEKKPKLTDEEQARMLALLLEPDQASSDWQEDAISPDFEKACED